jgi:hypothetical protein
MSLLGLFGRQAWVEIGPEGGPGVRLADLRVSFRIEHKSGKAVNTGAISIYNPAPSSIALLHVPLAAIRLLAGYDAPQVIFQGPPVKDGVELLADGPNKILKVDAADGGRAYIGTAFNLSLTTPSTFGQVLALVLAETLWARGYIDPAIEAVSLPHGIVLQGRPSEILDRLAAAAPPLGADWFVRDNALYVLPRGQATPEVAPLISSTVGNLIGSPTQTKHGCKVTALLDATMRPGRAFVVESLLVNGTFVAKDVTFIGDSGYDRDFYMQIVGRPLGVP